MEEEEKNLLREVLTTWSWCFCPCRGRSHRDVIMRHVRAPPMLGWSSSHTRAQIKQSNKQDSGARWFFLCRSSVRPTTSCQRVPLHPLTPRPLTPLALSLFLASSLQLLYPHVRCLSLSLSSVWAVLPIASSFILPPPHMSLDPLRVAPCSRQLLGIRLWVSIKLPETVLTVTDAL